MRIKSMHIFFLLGCFIAFNTPSIAQTVSVQINVTGLSNSKGTIVIGLYKSATDFPEYEANYKNATVDTSSPSYTFNNLEEGTYAIAVWHDENNNKKLDKNLFGIPKEKYGFSKNKFGKLGPPDFDEVSFNVKNGKTTTFKIKLK
ncbi:DUF2141 domain-containing protein [Flammeovirga pectinis]|uniref:DUF2141 domain-containing protein n=1 Tax=Flammeovirga pectinis TaxID=2494373 RepID=A0A3Q9FST0_9BACT|nr:DUF2141 domain-containing protein [Flammeovirga pectinis]AZQ64296.1 DUF2141 domain-containing protein [Flammeovirga pectinis]